MFGQDILTDNNYRELFSGEMIQKERAIKLKRDYYRELTSDGKLGKNTVVDYKLNEEEINMIIEQRDLLDWVNFENFLTNTYDLDKAHHIEMLEKQFPEYFEARMEHAMKSLWIQTQLFVIQLFGIQSLEDAEFVYQLAGHQIELQHTTGNAVTSMMLDSIYRKAGDDKKPPKGNKYDMFSFGQPHQINAGFNRRTLPKDVLNKQRVSMWSAPMGKNDFI